MKSIKKLRTKGWLIGTIAVFLTVNLTCCSRQKPTEKKVTIRFSNGEVVIEQIKLMEEITREFEKVNPDIKVKLEYGTSTNKIVTEIAGGTPPDVFMWWSGITDLKERNVLLPLNDYLKKYQVDLSEYFKCLVGYYTYDKKLYAFPLQLKTWCLIYNKDIFDKAHLSYPTANWTWNDYYQAAKKLTGDFNQDGKRDQFGTQLPPADYWIGLNGGEIIDLNQKKCVLDKNEEVKEALEFLVKLYRDSCPTTAEASAFSGQGGTQPFFTGKVAMVVAPAWMLSSISKIKTFSWDVAPVPKPPKRKRTHVFDDAGLCIPRQSKHPEEAFRFIKFYCGKKGMMIFAKERNGIPAYKEAAYKVFAVPPPEHLGYYLDAAEKATKPYVPRIKGWGEIEQAFDQQWELVLLREKNLENAIKDATFKINNLLSSLR